jgi:hypothetical protein
MPLCSIRIGSREAGVCAAVATGVGTEDQQEDQGRRNSYFGSGGTEARKRQKCRTETETGWQPRKKLTRRSRERERVKSIERGGESR